MLTIQLNDDIERILNQLAKQEHIQPEQLVSKLIARYANIEKLENEATELSSFQRFLLDSPEMSNAELQSIQGKQEHLNQWK
ncbi:MAG: hypothetical protein QX189_05310 [Methylococcales bacterium]